MSSSYISLKLQSLADLLNAPFVQTSGIPTEVLLFKIVVCVFIWGGIIWLFSNVINKSDNNE